MVWLWIWGGCAPTLVVGHCNVPKVLVKYETENNEHCKAETD